MDETKILIGLVALTLVLTLINSYNTFELSNKLNPTGYVADKADGSGEIREAQSLPTVKQPEQPSQPEKPSKIQVATDDDTVKGSESATVTIVEFSDFECSFCARFYDQTLPSIEENYIKTNKVKFVYRNFPLSFHRNAQKAAEAAECAGEQDKFWEMHDKLFENQNALATENLKQYAKDLGLDSSAFDECLDSGVMAPEVQKDFADGQTYGVSGTPTFFINGVKLVGAQPFSAFERAIEDELNK